MNRMHQPPLLVPAIWLLGLLLIFFLVSQANSQSVIRSSFDHDTTTFQLEGAHLVTSCANCHRSGVFSGTPLDCSGCHTQGRRIAATYQPARHIMTTQQCDACHTSDGFSPVLRVDHFEVIGTCFSCHNNQIVAGKPANHPPAGDMCDDCHRTVAFLPVRSQ